MNLRNRALRSFVSGLQLLLAPAVNATVNLPGAPVATPFDPVTHRAYIQKIEPLQNNGGPTQTIVLLPGTLRLTLATRAAARTVKAICSRRTSEAYRSLPFLLNTTSVHAAMSRCNAT